MQEQAQQQHEGGDATPIVGRHSVASVGGGGGGSGAGMRPPRSPLKQPKKACVPTLEDALDDVQVRKKSVFFRSFEPAVSSFILIFVCITICYEGRYLCFCVNDTFKERTVLQTDDDFLSNLKGNKQRTSAA